MLKIKFLLIVFLSLNISCYNNSTNNIVVQRLNYKIILTKTPTKTESFAADELGKFLQETYSEPIKLNGKTTEITFIISDTSEARKADIKNIPELKDKFGVFRKGRTFLFAGNDFKKLNPISTSRRQAGTLSAVYYFIKKYMHVNFYFPGSNGYTLSLNQPLLFKKTEDIPIPSFDVRSVSLQNQGFTDKESILFFRRSLGNLPYWSRHDYYYMFLRKWKKRFSETHPEYFGLYNGKRGSENYPYHLPCFSNPNVMKQTVDDIISAIEADPNIKTVRVFADCPAQFCKCENCMAMEERKYIGETKENGEMIYGIFKRIMNEVHKTYPNIHFLTQTKKYTASGNYYKPPQLIELGNQCTVEHLTERAMPYFDHSEDVEIAEQWNKNGVKLVLKSYERYPIFKDYPIIKSHMDQEFFKLFYGKVAGTRYSGAKKSIPYSFCALGEYLQLKMLFNINIDLDKEIAKFCSFAYPGAEQETIQFYNKMEKLFMGLESRSKPMFSYVYCADSLAQPMHLLNEASKKVMPESKYFQALYSDFKKFYNDAKQARN